MKELHEKIKEYKAILADKKLLLGVIKTEISEIADKYGSSGIRSSIEISYSSYPIEVLLSSPYLSAISDRSGKKQA